MSRFVSYTLFTIIYVYSLACSSSAQSNVLLTYIGADETLQAIFGSLQPTGEITWSVADTLAYIPGGPIAPVVFNNQVYIFHEGTGGGISKVVYNIASDTWGPDAEFTTPNYESYGPEATVVGSEIWLLFVPSISPSSVWAYTSSDGVSFSGGDSPVIPGISSTTVFNAVFYNSYVYVFYVTAGNQLSYVRYNLATGFWSAPTVVPLGITNTPALVVANGYLYVFHQGSNADGLLYYDRFDGTNWAGDTQISPLWEPINENSGPAVVFINGFFYIYYVGNDNLVYFTAVEGSNFSQGPIYRVYEIPYASGRPGAVTF